MSQQSLFGEQESDASTSDTSRHPASPRRLPASARVKPMKGISGRLLSDSLQTSKIHPCGPLGSVLRTLVESKAWYSTIGSPTWELSATPRFRLLFRLRLSVRRISESECSLWRTPTANSDRQGDAGRQSPRLSAGEGVGQVRLVDQVAAVQLWPTPSSSRPNDGETLISCLPRNQRLEQESPSGGYGMPLAIAVQMWPTPTTSEMNGPGIAGDGSPNLRTAVLWSTPAAQDAKNSSLPESQAVSPSLPGDVMRASARPTPQAHDTAAGQSNRVKRHGTKHGDRNLNDDVAKAERQERAYLSPAWVSSLMGFPDGWLDVD